MRTFRQLREAEESSNQIKKIKITFGDSEAGYDAEWNLGKIETEITLAMGDHSKDLYTLSDDISDFNGIFTSSTECLLKLNNRVDRLNCRDTSSLRYDLNVLICFSLL